MAAVDPNLRLSAQRALLGVISPEIRLVKVRRDGDRIRFTTLVSRPPTDALKAALSVAAAEVTADFPECRIEEILIESLGPLPVEDVLEEGWVYLRAEPSKHHGEQLGARHDRSPSYES